MGCDAVQFGRYVVLWDVTPCSLVGMYIVGCDAVQFGRYVHCGM